MESGGAEELKEKGVSTLLPYSPPATFSSPLPCTPSRSFPLFSAPPLSTPLPSCPLHASRARGLGCGRIVSRSTSCNSNGNGSNSSTATKFRQRRGSYRDPTIQGPSADPSPGEDVETSFAEITDGEQTGGSWPCKLQTSRTCAAKAKSPFGRSPRPPRVRHAAHGRARCCQPCCEEGDAAMSPHPHP